MQLLIANNIPPIHFPIVHHKPVMLVGSCFTENMGQKLVDRGFAIHQNPHGILFNPVSVIACLRDVMCKNIYTVDNLFYLHEQWHSWLHHSRFSGNTQQEALQKINESIVDAHTFLQTAGHIIITLGSAFAYRHSELDMHVSNNHRAPSQWFAKELLDINYMAANLQQLVEDLIAFNPELKIIFTISPVRHLRDGVVDNNKSKARLIETVHNTVNNNSACCYYFPSYEIIIDELRDYRFYDVDMAHPNYAATAYVWEKFLLACIDNNCHSLLEQLYTINKASQHRSVNPISNAHQAFLINNINKCNLLQAQYKYLNLKNYIDLFKSALV